MAESLSENILLNIFEQSAGSLIIKADLPYFTILAASNLFLTETFTRREDIIGKSFLEVFSGNISSDGTTALDVLEKVVATNTNANQPVFERKVVDPRSGIKQQIYWATSYVPIAGKDGKVAYIVNNTTNVTDKVRVEGKLLASEANLLNLIKQAPVAISILNGYDLIIQSVNDAMLEVWGKDKRVIGKKLADGLPELEGQPFIGLLQHVYKSGTAYYGTETMVTLNRNGHDQVLYFNFVYHPITGADKTVTGIMVVATEVTGQVNARHELEESSRQFRNLVTQSPVGMGILRGRDMVVEVCNDMLLQIWGKRGYEVVNEKLLDIFPELQGQPFPKILDDVYTTGKSYSENEATVYIATPDAMLKYHVNFTYEPLLDIDGSVSGIMVTVVDVTDGVEARQKLEDAEERIRLATEATGLATWDLDLKTRDIIHSSRLAEIFGRPSTEHIPHQKLRTIIHPDDLGAVERAFDKALKTANYFYEVRVVWDDGAIHWIRTHGKVIYDEQQQPARMIGTILDVTGQRILIDELKRSEENLRLATQAAELGTFDYNVKTNKTRWDDRCRVIFGVLNNRSVTHDTFLQVLHDDDREQTEQAVQDALIKSKTNGDYSVDYRVIGLDDRKLRWVRAKGKTFFDEDGQPVRLIGSVMDITEVKKDEMRKNDFIAMASHELKTPLTSLKAYIQMLLITARKNGDVFLENSLQKADNQVGKMTRLIYGFLDLSKIESGKLHLNLSSFNLNDVIEEAIADTRPIAQSHHIVFNAAEEIIITADTDKINQVLTNLINNAVKYSPKGSTIHVQSAIAGGTVQVSVTDEGIGVKPEDELNIFQRFYRVEDDTTRGFSGFGIGLYLSAEIVNLHKGRIWVKSNAGKGSTFSFVLPLK
ncbi:MAG: PAS domain-containing protein [Bacteroidota bacterium]